MPAEGEDPPRARTSVSVDGSGLKEVLGLRFQDSPLLQVADEIVQDAKKGVRREVFFVNAHCVNVAVKNNTYSNILHSTPVLFADGIGMAIAARIFGDRFRYNVNGTDLFPLICERARQERVPIALLGAAPGRAEKCAARITKLYEGLEVVWTGHGFLPEADEREALNKLNASGARILLVAKGVPKQEIWIREYGSQISVPVLVGVGALLDFFSGSTPRAPLMFRRLRIEWVFRLFLEPRRMFRRYVIGNHMFIYRAIRARLGYQLR